MCCALSSNNVLLLQGRVGVHHVEDAQQSKNFTFKCHRDGTDIYAVNAITFHPVHGTFVTAGSDGAYNFWDKVLACWLLREADTCCWL